MVACAAPEISRLVVEQPITAKNQIYSVTPALKITFTLAAPADAVTIAISRHLASYATYKWPYLAEPYLVRTLSLGKMSAGPQTVDWDGLDDHGKPLTETHNLPSATVLAATVKPTTADQLTETVPVNFIQVAVKAGGEQLTENFERGSDTLQPNRRALPFRMATTDKEGNYVIADFAAWWVYGYSPDFARQPEKMWPKVVPLMAMDASPPDVQAVRVDSHGNVFAMDVGGVYRFSPDGIAQPWPHQADYVANPPHGNVLGIRTTDPVQGAKPGFSSLLTGFDIDDKDNIYLARYSPDPCIEIFGDDGAYLRKLALPAGKLPGNIAWLVNNTLAVGGGNTLVLLDAATGAVKKTLTDPPSGFFATNFLQADRDGNIYTGPQAYDIFRYTPSGDPLPFNTALANVDKVHPNHLMLSAAEVKVPVATAGYPPGGVDGYAFAPDGSFYASANDATTGGDPADLLHYAKDGTFLPDNLLAAWGSHALGNVFVDNEPATLELLITNFSEKKQPFTVHWTLTDYYEKKTSGVIPLTAEPLARQTIPFTIPAMEMGHYRLEAEVRQGDKFAEKLSAQLARIPSRPIVADRWSPFAMVWIGEFELMARAGVKSHRGDSLSWANQVEPLDGVFYPEHPEVLQYNRGGADTLRAFARKWGFYNLNGLDYGENWLGGDWVGAPTLRAYSYDRFFDYCLKMVDLLSGKGEAFYQFWNEPNDFWNMPGPFNREHFTFVQQQIWSMIKARDKNVWSMPDGDGGSTKMMEDFAALGAAPWTDTVLMHYPGATVYSMDNITFTGMPESKVPSVQKLVALRDKSFPGKQVWNTEENIPINSASRAANIPRNYISQIAAGVDKIYQFSQTGTGAGRHDTTCFLDENGQPFPTYVSYATMTRMIGDSVFAGQADFGKDAYGYLFARPHDFVLAANCLAGTQDVTVDAGAPGVIVVDLMGRSRKAATDDGKLKLTLTPEMQYVVLPRTGGALEIARTELKKQLAALQIDDVTAIPGAVDEVAKPAATDGVAMNRLYHLVKTAEIAGAAGEAPETVADNAAPMARTAVETREGADGYLGGARVALDWTDRLAQEAHRDPTMNLALLLAAKATASMAGSEAPLYPGVAIDAMIGEPGEIEKIRAIVPVANKPETTIDEKFRFQIDRKPGDSFELELTIRNYYHHRIDGSVTPRAPDSWQASPTSANYSVEPGKWQRFLFNVSIPTDAKKGVISVGGQTPYSGATVQELHPGRINL